LSTNIELLMSLQRIDQSISGKKREADEAARQLRALEAAVRQRAAEAAQLHDEHAVLKAQQTALERELAEIEERMKDRRMRLQRIRSEKELQATRREIETMKERTTQLEEQELQVLEVMEALAAKIAAADDNLRGGQQALEDERASLVARESALVQEIDRDSAARGELAGNLDGALRRRYEAVFARHGGRAVVIVRDGACQGCHMHVPPQLINEILRGERVFDCPSCHRILFAANENHSSE
jgi:predicted  nucleic acid-binding Zn-ribbon protein